MDLRAMALVMAAIAVERVAPAGERVARAMGAVVCLGTRHAIHVGVPAARNGNHDR